MVLVNEWAVHGLIRGRWYTMRYIRGRWYRVVHKCKIES